MARFEFAPFLQRILVILWAAVLAGCAAYAPPRQGETIHRNLTYAHRSGRDLGLDLYVPTKAQPVPLVVWIHGGGWAYGTKGFNLQVRDLTRDGFAVAAIDYRLLRTARWPAQIDDCVDAVDWLRQNAARYGIDARRVGLSGESAGGHLAALMAVKQNRPAIKAVCVLYPPTDMVRMKERYEKFGNVSIIRRLFPGNESQRAASAYDASPVNFVTRSAPPFLIYHGDKDWLVPVEQSKLLDARLRHVGVKSELIVFPGETHAFVLNDEEIRRVSDFFHTHLF